MLKPKEHHKSTYINKKIKDKGIKKKIKDKGIPRARRSVIILHKKKIDIYRESGMFRG